MTLSYIGFVFLPRPGQYCACKCRNISNVTPNPNLQKEVVTINTIEFITKGIYYLEHENRETDPYVFSAGSCKLGQDSLVCVNAEAWAR